MWHHLRSHRSEADFDDLDEVLFYVAEKQA